MTKTPCHSLNSCAIVDTKLKANNSLSDYMPRPESFPTIETVIKSFQEDSFLALSVRKRFKKINQMLCELIQNSPPQSFLLSSVLDYLDRINQSKLLPEPLNFATFEFWLNVYSNLSDKDNFLIRAKIVGKDIPRSDYQAFFPIGMNRTFNGTHFVVAHLSPDVDTMIASFWGWVDAFAARLGTGLHLWSLPGGPPDSPVTTIICEMFGPTVFSSVARKALTLTLTAMDLVGQQKLTKELGHKQTGELDHGVGEKAIILVNEQGHYLGDWRISDVELVRPVIISFKSCLRWFENNLHTKIISLFAKKDLSTSDLPAFISSIFDVRIRDCEPAVEFTEKQKQNLHDFFRIILGIKNGLDGTFRDLNEAFSRLSIEELTHFREEIEKLPTTAIFDAKGNIVEDRPIIFYHLDRIIKNLDNAIYHVRNYVERLDVVLGIKHHVLGLPLLYITLHSDVEEIKQKMQNYDSLTAVTQDQDGSLVPVGIVRSADLRKSSLGTVSFRDFCNTDEVKMASYLEVISVVDHHKSALKTTSVPSAIIADAQSCNVLIAEQAFAINDRYSLGGMTQEAIEKQIQDMGQNLSSASNIRILQRLLQRRIAAQANHSFFVHPKREFDEYLSCLHAILDDTDLLTKVSNRDVECVAQILNRLKSLSLHQEVEVVSFDDIPKDKNFAKVAAQRILKHEDMYSLYKKVYDYKESEIEVQLELCAKGNCSNIFVDTKEQNGCSRVGQTKMFTSNFPCFFKNESGIRQYWFKQARESNLEQPYLDLHIHMISTIASAEEVYQNQIGPYPHSDELWFWITPTQQARDHLASFLASFQHIAKGLQNEEMHLEFLGPNADVYKQIFDQNFLPIPQKLAANPEKGLPIAILRFKAGTLNSRKSMITPFIPKLVP